MLAINRILWLILFHLITNVTAQDCDYKSETRTYFCNNIVDVFPRKFYGNYHLRCFNCNIKTFSNQTFPPENNLISFNVSESGIRHIMSNAFTNLGNVQYIYLQHNQIIDILPDAFAGLKQVYELHLQYNLISELLPGFLRDLEANSVDLSHNKINELPNGAFDGSLSILSIDLSHNRLNKINIDSFRDLESLEILNLEHNRICHLSLGIFQHVSSLRDLNLADNKLSRFAVGAFSGLRNLWNFNLANNSIVELDASILLPLNHINKLDVSRNGIYYLDAYEIYASAPTLRTIRMDDNLFSCTLLVNVMRYFKSVKVDVVNQARRFEVQNIDGIACIDVVVKDKVDFANFMEFAANEVKKYNVYC